MRGSLFALIALSLLACGGAGSDDDDTPVDASDPPPTGPWGGSRRVAVPGVPSNATFDHTLSPDRLEIFVNDPDGGIARATRATVDDAFGPLENVAALAFDNDGPDPVLPWGPRLTPDGRTIYFTAHWPRGSESQLHRATRDAIGGAWSTPEHVAELSVGFYQAHVSTCADGVQLVFEGSSPGANAIYERRGGQIRQLGELIGDRPSSVTATYTPFISADCRTLYFGMSEEGISYLWVTHRATPADPWGTPERVTELIAATGATRASPWMSPDQHHLVVEEHFFDLVNREFVDTKLLELSR